MKRFFMFCGLAAVVALSFLLALPGCDEQTSSRGATDDVISHSADCKAVGLTPPVFVLEAGMFKDGGSVSAKLKDKAGKEVDLYLNNRMMDPNRGTLTLDGQTLDMAKTQAVQNCLKDALTRISEPMTKSAIQGVISPR